MQLIMALMWFLFLQDGSAKYARKNIAVKNICVCQHMHTIYVHVYVSALARICHGAWTIGHLTKYGLFFTYTSVDWSTSLSTMPLLVMYTCIRSSACSDSRQWWCLIITWIPFRNSQSSRRALIHVLLTNVRRVRQSSKARTCLTSRAVTSPVHWHVCGTFKHKILNTHGERYGTMETSGSFYFHFCHHYTICIVHRPKYIQKNTC